MNNSQNWPVPFVLIKKDYVIQDAEVIRKENKLRMLGKNGRKIVATSVISKFDEELIDDPIWKVPKILPTGDGGLEIASFTEFAGQDRHKHKKSIEIYTVLKGTMEIYIDDKGPYSVYEGDEVVILPGTIHQVVQKNPRPDLSEGDFDLLVRVHAMDCYGNADKYVQLNPNGDWERWDNISREEKDRAYKK
jgi:mannose-6-phosphate isomerase-like protein (cupin superfamily)